VLLEGVVPVGRLMINVLVEMVEWVKIYRNIGLLF